MVQRQQTVQQQVVRQWGITGAAKPPQATTVASFPIASRYRCIIPSTMLAAPRMVPDFMQSTVLVPITCRTGLSRLI